MDCNVQEEEGWLLVYDQTIMSTIKLALLLLSLLSLSLNSVFQLFYSAFPTVYVRNGSVSSQWVCLLLSLSTMMPVCQLGLSSETIQITTSARWSIPIVMPLDHPPGTSHYMVSGHAYLSLSRYHYGTSQAGTSRQYPNIDVKLLHHHYSDVTPWSNQGSDIIVSPPGLMTSR